MFFTTSSVLAEKSLSTTLLQKKEQPHTARCLCKRSQDGRRIAAAHLVCYGHFSPGRRLSPPETPPEASSATAAKQFQVPPVSTRRLSRDRGGVARREHTLKDLFFFFFFLFSSSPLDSHVVEHRFCIICIVKKQVDAEIRQGLKQTPSERAGEIVSQDDFCRQL